MSDSDRFAEMRRVLDPRTPEEPGPYSMVRRVIFDLIDEAEGAADGRGARWRRTVEERIDKLETLLGVTLAVADGEFESLSRRLDAHDVQIGVGRMPLWKRVDAQENMGALHARLIQENMTDPAHAHPTEGDDAIEDRISALEQKETVRTDEDTWRESVSRHINGLAEAHRGFRASLGEVQLALGLREEAVRGVISRTDPRHPEFMGSGSLGAEVTQRDEWKERCGELIRQRDDQRARADELAGELEEINARYVGANQDREQALRRLHGAKVNIGRAFDLLRNGDIAEGVDLLATMEDADPLPLLVQERDEAYVTAEQARAALGAAFWERDQKTRRVADLEAILMAAFESLSDIVSGEDETVSVGDVRNVRAFIGESIRR